MDGKGHLGVALISLPGPCVAAVQATQLECHLVMVHPVSMSNTSKHTALPRQLHLLLQTMDMSALPFLLACNGPEAAVEHKETVNLTALAPTQSTSDAQTLLPSANKLDLQ